MNIKLWTKKRNLYDAVDDAVPKTTRELLKAIIFAVSIPAHFFAMQLRKSIEGLGIDEETLSRVLVTRHEVDMGFIKAYYKLDGKYELVEDSELIKSSKVFLMLSFYAII